MSRRAFILGLGVIAILIFSLYRAKDGARDTQAEIQRIEADIAKARALQVDLKVELAHRSRQEWIEAYAREELGMIPPQGPQFISPADLDTVIGPAMEPEESISDRITGTGHA